MACLLLLGGCVGSPRPAAVSAPTGAAEFDWFLYEGNDPQDAASLVTADRYRNPILQGFYPDPSTTRVGDDYYLVGSTFSWFPGIPIFHSRDLVRWTQIGNAIDRPEQLDFGTLGMSRGVFAPDISNHADTFYIVNTCVDCGGNFVITAGDPAGPWSDPIWLRDLEGGIDPSLFFDDDGSAWIVNNGPPVGAPLYEGHRALWIQRFDPVARRTFGPRTLLVNGGVDLARKPVWIEGPHIFRKDGFYYLTAAEGGTEVNHSQVVLRSRSVTGPYEPYAGNPILTQRDLPADRPNPITSAGHADFVETQTGEWWATFLAVRPYQGDFYNTGRETFLLPVSWQNGWPRITAPGAPIPLTHPRPDLPIGASAPVPTNGAFSVREDFDGTALPPTWLMMRNPRQRWYALANGRLSLQPRAVSLGDFGNPSLLGRRQQHLNATASTSVRFAPHGEGDEAGLVALQNDEYWFFLSVSQRDGHRIVKLERRAGPSDPAGGVEIAAAPLPGNAEAPVSLRIRARGGSYDFFYATRDGAWQALRQGEDGKILSTRIAGGFVGSFFGLHAYRGSSPPNR
ncbi:glycoside hydrolase family 43 protein [Sphingosinicella sp. BN140058]|uniref:glycoside hydrolase family 43 protein n=1 Tax=Sphingosinicella sp. BN140058 TaxID=1892855 RepID=UPI001FB07B03|nr:glycoside hydrolase family 43 protein [Sphingosinicella sp. BN140058]